MSPMMVEGLPMERNLRMSLHCKEQSKVLCGSSSLQASRGVVRPQPLAPENVKRLPNLGRACNRSAIVLLCYLEEKKQDEPECIPQRVSDPPAPPVHESAAAKRVLGCTSRANRKIDDLV